MLCYRFRIAITQKSRLRGAVRSLQRPYKVERPFDTCIRPCDHVEVNRRTGLGLQHRTKPSHRWTRQSSLNAWNWMSSLHPATASSSSSPSMRTMTSTGLGLPTAALDLTTLICCSSFRSSCREARLKELTFLLKLKRTFIFHRPF